MKTYERWLYVNPDMGSFLETVPLGPNLADMSAGLSIQRALMWRYREEAETYKKDIQTVNPAFKLARVTIEIEEVKE